jgi:uncharacterized protein involved in outer membrane biogenesis
MTPMDNAGTEQAAESAHSPTSHAEVSTAVDPENDRPGRWRRRVTLSSLVAVLLAAAIVLPPLVNAGRYQRQITALLARSLGRPVHFSSVGLRLLPRPGFIIHDLSVSEDKAFGDEPILSARTVIASIRIISLWRGHLEIDRVSVDDASLNLVRNQQGRWNLESLMMGAQPGLATEPQASNPSTAQRGRTPAHFPYLEATNSRVNLKQGAEKRPFSLVSTDLSLWQDNPGEWRVRLSGSPVRTDVEMILADTGEVRMEATLQSAAQLREMPIKLQAEWKDAQLGQLSRMMLGKDEGWRGGLRVDVELQGTMDSAQTKARLRATGVRREEFTPDSPLDLETNCSFRYQHSQQAAHNIVCDTAIGHGQLHLQGEYPGLAGTPQASLDVQHVPLQAGLDMLRIVRSGFAPGISIDGAANGNLTYQAMQAATSSAEHANKAAGPLPSPSNASSSLQGTLVMENGVLRGGELKEPLTLPMIAWAPTASSYPTAAVSGEKPKKARTPAPPIPTDTALALGTQFSVHLPPLPPAQSPKVKVQAVPQDSSQSPAGDPAETTAPLQNAAKVKASTVSTPSSSTPSIPSLNVSVSATAKGYKVLLNGFATLAKLRQLVYATGVAHNDAADSFSAGTASFSLTASGPWIPAEDTDSFGTPSAPLAGTVTGADSLAGSATLHHAQWKPAYLPQAIDLPQGTLTITPGNFSLISEFTYGLTSPRPIAGSSDQVQSAEESSHQNTERDLLAGKATVTIDRPCSSPPCRPRIQLHFSNLDAAFVQSALLGPPLKKASLLSPLIDKMSAKDKASFPDLPIQLDADSLVLGPVTLKAPALQIRLKQSEIQIESWQASMLGGSANGTGSLNLSGNKPVYAFEGTFIQIDPVALGTLLGSPLTGHSLSGSGKVQLTGLDQKEQAASANGEFKFALPPSSKGLGNSVLTSGQSLKFDQWSGSGSIQGGKVHIQKSEMLAGKRTSAVTGTVPFGGPAKLSVLPGAPKASKPAAD